MEEQLCKFNQEGFCKFGANCYKRHENEICNRNQCESPQCSKRHPQLCKFYFQFGQCKFGDICAFSHRREDTSNREKRSLEKEVEELKDEIKNMKEENTKTKEKDLEKEVESLKEDMKKLKEEMMKKMDRILSFLGTDDEAESNSSNKKGNEKGKVSDEPKFKCDKCSYTTKRSITLKKHINTKHQNKDGNGETEKSKSEMKKGDMEEKKKEMKSCDDCQSCENCEYAVNMKSCQLCMMLFEAALEEYDY